MATTPSDESLSLNDLLLTLQGAVADFFPSPLWVRCDILAAHPRAKGYWRLQVQDPEVGGRAAAEILVWRDRVPGVIDRFKRETGQPLGPGMQVLLQVRVAFHPQWGFTLTAQGIEPAFTLGQAQVEADRIRHLLQQEGVWDANRRLAPPLSFARVALIAPDGSAGLGDVQRETERMEAAGVCAFPVFLAPFEGPHAIRALTAQIQALNDPGAFDAICLVRGGGASAGIQTLNHEALVRAVCQCPIPIFVGVGHERDQTLLDEVAFASLGTPSKTIGHIQARLIEQAQQAEQAWGEVERRARLRLEEAQARIEERRQTLRHQAQALLDRATHRTDRWAQDLRTQADHLLLQATHTVTALRTEAHHRSDRLLTQAQGQTEAWMREALNLGPMATLARGYAWVSDPQGRPITAAQHARVAEHLTLHFADGTAAAHPDGTP